MPKRSKRKTLINKLDAAVSAYVIRRDGCCVQCGTSNQLTCGHLFSRRLMSLRWDLDNCHCQCWPDNFRHNHYPEYYTAWFLREFGKAKYLKLEARAHQVKKWSIPELEDMLSEVERLTAELG
jgi:5-methylcytosine-specific restriction endonuclease McrA